MGINLAIQKLKETIANDINASRLPPTVVSMVLGEFVEINRMLSQQAIEAEKKAEEEAKDGKEIHKT